MYIGIIDCRPMLQAGRWREPRTEMTTRIAKRYIIASVFLTARELENYPFDRINNNDLMWTRKQETIDVLLTKTETITMLCSLWISDSNLRRWNHSLEQSDVRKAESLGQFKSLLKEGMAFMESSFLFNNNNYKKKKKHYSSWNWLEVRVGNDFSQLFSLHKMSIIFFPKQKPSSSFVKTETREKEGRSRKIHFHLIQVFFWNSLFHIV